MTRLVDQLKKINNQWLFDSLYSYHKSAPLKFLKKSNLQTFVLPNKQHSWWKNRAASARMCVCHVLTVIACMLNPSPSCLHATMASLVVQPSLHTLPHRCPTRTSTRPSYCERPPDRRTCNHNLRHVKHTHTLPRSPSLLPFTAYPHTQKHNPAEKNGGLIYTWSDLAQNIHIICGKFNYCCGQKIW